MPGGRAGCTTAAREPVSPPGRRTGAGHSSPPAAIARAERVPVSRDRCGGAGLGLTSPALVVALSAAVIVTLAAMLWWWPRLAVPGARAVVLRIAALAALQASVLGLIFVIANRSAEFYSSWSDLFGTDHASAAIVAVGSGLEQACRAHQGHLKHGRCLSQAGTRELAAGCRPCRSTASYLGWPRRVMCTCLRNTHGQASRRSPFQSTW